MGSGSKGGPDTLLAATLCDSGTKTLLSSASSLGMTPLRSWLDQADWSLRSAAWGLVVQVQVRTSDTLNDL